MRFLPREEKFFHFFLQQAAIIRDAAKLLQSSCHTGQPSLQATAEQIATLEANADLILHDIFEKLNATFITPIDPEDIHALASFLDDVMDHIEDGAHRMNAYQVDEITPELKELVDLIAQCTESLEKAFQSLEEGKSVMAHCIEINRAEGAADVVERRAVANLFRNEKDPIRLLKYKEIYEIFELATDACEDVADHLQNVVVKNS